MTFFVRTLVLISCMAVLLPNMTNAAPVNHKRHSHEPWHNPCNMDRARYKKGKITPAVKRDTYVVSPSHHLKKNIKKLIKFFFLI